MALDVAQARSDLAVTFSLERGGGQIGPDQRQQGCVIRLVKFPLTLIPEAPSPAGG
jgi:hypothetical protein